MKYLRWALGALVGLYVLRNLYFFVLTVGAKTGAMPLSGDMIAVQPLIDAFAWWHIALWAAAIAGYVIAALRYFRGGKALVPLVVAGVLDGSLFLMMRTMPGYPPQAEQIDMLCLAGIVLAVLITWWTERSDTAPVAA